MITSILLGWCKRCVPSLVAWLFLAAGATLHWLPCSCKVPQLGCISGALPAPSFEPRVLPYLGCSGCSLSGTCSVLCAKGRAQAPILCHRW